MEKRKDVLHYHRKKKDGIICLQDVHLDETMGKNEWRYQLYMNPFKSIA